MKLEQLEQVVEIANTKSINKAAMHLFLSQPSLSTSLRQLEQELGSDLFVRTRKGVELTPFGMNFVKYAEKVLNDVADLGKLSNANLAPISRTLSLAHGHFRYASLVVAMLLNRHREDGAQFILRNGIPEDCINWVADGICDIGVITFATNEEHAFRQQMMLRQLRYETIYQPPTKIVIGTGHPLFNTQVTEIDQEELKKYSLITYDDVVSSKYHRALYMQKSLTPPRCIVTDRASMYEMLECTDGYCIGFSNDIVYTNIPRQARTRTLYLKGKTKPYSVAWIAPANVEFMQLAKEYIELLTDVCTRPDFWALHPDISLGASGQP